MNSRSVEVIGGADPPSVRLYGAFCTAVVGGFIPTGRRETSGASQLTTWAPQKFPTLGSAPKSIGEQGAYPFCALNGVSGRNGLKREWRKTEHDKISYKDGAKP